MYKDIFDFYFWDRGSTKHATMHRRTLMAKNYLVQNINSVKFEIPWYRKLLSKCHHFFQRSLISLGNTLPYPIPILIFFMTKFPLVESSKGSLYVLRDVS